MVIKKISLMLLIFSLSIYFFSCSNSTEPVEITIPENEEDDSSPYVKELNNIINELKGASPTLDNSDLQPFAYLGNVNLVALGEATHGTKEFFQIKHRILKYLVEEHDFKVFGIEADMGESFYIDKYVITGEGNLTDLMKTKMHFWTWKTEEVKEMIEWMKNYNLNKSENDKIHYIGFDCQFLSFQDDIIVEYYQKTKPDFLNTVKEKLGQLHSLDFQDYQTRETFINNMTITSRDKIITDMDDLLNSIVSQKSELISKSSEYEYNLVKQLIRNIQQTIEVQYNYKHGGSNENLRDKYMAENSVWISSLFGPITKSVLWAHNGHIANNNTYGGGGSMGFRLKSQFLEEYQIVGFSFSKGSFTAVNQTTGLGTQLITTPPDTSSINNFFYKAKHDNFILIIKEIPSNYKLNSWLDSPRPMISIGAVFNGDPKPYYYIDRIKILYDVLINYDITNFAVPLK